MSGHIRLKSFRQVKKSLHKIGIFWTPERGKGSHGCFIGPNQKTGRLHTFPLPSHQQREINIDYIKRLRDRFGLDETFFYD
jgi:predicted RNA binding protein YcfA (HicA-like mRNA interferase family)